MPSQFRQLLQVMAVAILGQRRGKAQQLLGVDPAGEERNFLRATDFQTLSVFDGLDVGRCLGEGFRSAAKPATRPS